VLQTTKFGRWDSDVETAGRGMSYAAQLLWGDLLDDDTTIYNYAHEKLS